MHIPHPQHDKVALPHVKAEILLRLLPESLFQLIKECPHQLVMS